MRALAAVFQLIASPKLLPAIYFALASQCGLLLAGPALVDETGDARVRTRRVAQGAAVRSVMYLAALAAAAAFALAPSDYAEGLDAFVALSPWSVASLVVDALAKMLVTSVVGTDAVASAVARAATTIEAVLPDGVERAGLRQAYDYDDQPRAAQVPPALATAGDVELADKGGARAKI